MQNKRPGRENQRQQARPCSGDKGAQGDIKARGWGEKAPEFGRGHTGLAWVLPEEF